MTTDKLSKRAKGWSGAEIAGQRYSSCSTVRVVMWAAGVPFQLGAE